MTEEEYAAEIKRQREIGVAYVERLLDGWVRECGWQPHETWRAWRHWRRSLHALRAETYFALAIRPPDAHLMLSVSFA